MFTLTADISLSNTWTHMTRAWTRTNVNESGTYILTVHGLGVLWNIWATTTVWIVACVFCYCCCLAECCIVAATCSWVNTNISSCGCHWTYLPKPQRQGEAQAIQAYLVQNEYLYVSFSSSIGRFRHMWTILLECMCMDIWLISLCWAYWYHHMPNLIFLL